MWLFCILCHLIMEHRCMTQPGSDEMVYRVLLEHAATNSAKSSEQSVESETNSASDLGGDKGFNIPPILTNLGYTIHTQGTTLTDVLPSCRWSLAEQPARTWKPRGRSISTDKL